MRIVAGAMRGRTIAAPEGDGTRPTTDRVREALFSSLYSLRGGFEGAVVLDAFAGSGALGLEALSRGAKSAVFFECDRAAMRVLRKNIEACGLAPKRAKAVQGDVFQKLRAAAGDPFDLVFLDPPYSAGSDSVLVFVERMLAEGAISSDALIVYEHAKASSGAVGDAVQGRGFAVVTAKTYGKTGITVLKAS